MRCSGLEVFAMKMNEVSWAAVLHIEVSHILDDSGVITSTRRSRSLGKAHFNECCSVSKSVEAPRCGFR